MVVNKASVGVDSALYKVEIWPKILLGPIQIVESESLTGQPSLGILSRGCEENGFDKPSYSYIALITPGSYHFMNLCQ